MSATGIYHTLRVEHTDRAGRKWCAVCRLPHTNFKARAAHTPRATVEDITKTRVEKE